MVIGDKKIYNKAISLYEKLSNEFNKDWNSITLCSAFLSDSAAHSLVELIDDIDDDRKLEFTIMIGIKNNFTSPSAIQILIDYINTCNNPNIEFNLRLPMDKDFHLKVYVFKNEHTSNVIVGSANLTDTGLKSIGELMIDINSEEDANEIIECLSNYLNCSEPWIDCIEEYEKRYKKNKPTIIDSDTQGLKRDRLKNKKIKREFRRLGKDEYKFTNLVAPTMGTLYKLSKEDSNRVDMELEMVQREHSNIVKTNSILFSEQSYEDIKYIHNKYKIGSYFDKPDYANQNWDIGDKRSICTIGAIKNISEDEVVIFMKRGCIHYEVTEEIINEAEELEVKSIDEDEECTPSKINMDKYIKFIKKHR